MEVTRPSGAHSPLTRPSDQRGECTRPYSPLLAPLLTLTRPSLAPPTRPSPKSTRPSKGKTPSPPQAHPSPYISSQILKKSDLMCKPKAIKNYPQAIWFGAEGGQAGPSQLGQARPDWSTLSYPSTPWPTLATLVKPSSGPPWLSLPAPSCPLVAPGCILFVFGCSWLLLAAPGCFWLLLVVPGCFWLLLCVSGCSWLILAGPGCSWLLLAAPGCS